MAVHLQAGQQGPEALGPEVLGPEVLAHSEWAPAHCSHLDRQRKPAATSVGWGVVIAAG